VLAAEGAVLLRLEPVAGRPAADPAPLALLLGGRLAFDASASAAGWGDGDEVLGDALAGLLQELDISPGKVDLIVSGAGGSRRGDALEARILRRVWGDSPLPAVIAPKALTGEFGGGFLAAAVLAAAGRLPALPAVQFEPDPGLGITPLWGAPVAPPRRTLITVPASGGPYGWLLLEAAGP
jgi:3-oxoacyl-(acyl-carrier-protein) synthase